MTYKFLSGKIKKAMEYADQLLRNLQISQLFTVQVVWH